MYQIAIVSSKATKLHNGQIESESVNFRYRGKCSAAFHESNKETSQVLVIVGMHRSGTSLLANYLNSCGLNIGDNLLGATKHNKAGYYEDISFVRFHDRVMSEAGDSWYLETGRTSFPIDERLREIANTILAERSALPLWGWKDPRTVLFLDFWLDLCPHARFVFIYRKPAQVLQSLRERRDSKLQLQLPKGKCLFRYWKATWLWTQYNSLILDFMDRYPEKCLLFCLEDIAEVKTNVVEVIQNHFGIEGLKHSPLENIFHSEFLTQEASLFYRIWCRLTPRLCRIQKELHHRRAHV